VAHALRFKMTHRHASIDNLPINDRCCRASAAH
jgi:hypothetical protein